MSNDSESVQIVFLESDRQLAVELTGSPDWLAYNYNPILDILANFNFTQVHDVMAWLNWTWGYTNAHIPTIEELRSCAQLLLEKVTTDDLLWSATGGFVARKDHDALRLYFSIADYASDNQLL